MHIPERLEPVRNWIDSLRIPEKLEPVRRWIDPLRIPEKFEAVKGSIVLLWNRLFRRS